MNFGILKNKEMSENEIKNQIELDDEEDSNFDDEIIGYRCLRCNNIQGFSHRCEECSSIFLEPWYG